MLSRIKVAFAASFFLFSNYAFSAENEDLVKLSVVSGSKSNVFTIEKNNKKVNLIHKGPNRTKKVQLSKKDFDYIVENIKKVPLNTKKLKCDLGEINLSILGKQKSSTCISYTAKKEESLEKLANLLLLASNKKRER